MNRYIDQFENDLSRHGEEWTLDEVVTLIEHSQNLDTISDIALKMKRSVS